MFWLSAPTQRAPEGAAALLLLSYTKKKKEKKQTSNTAATPRICGLEKGTARAWGAHGCLFVLFPGCRFDSPPEQRTGGRSGGVWLGNVLESTSRHIESLTLPWDLLFALCGKTSGFHPTLPATSRSVLRISLHSTNTTASG